MNYCNDKHLKSVLTKLNTFNIKNMKNSFKNNSVKELVSILIFLIHK
jgi:hypothetical protein